MHADDTDQNAGLIVHTDPDPCESTLFLPPAGATIFVHNGNRPPDRLIGSRDVCERTTLSIAKIDDLIIERLFPPSSSSGCRRRWSERVVDSWLFNRMELRNSMVSLQDVPAFPPWTCDMERDDLPYVGLRLLTRPYVLHLLGIEKSELYRRIKLSHCDCYEARRPRVERLDVPPPVPLTVKRRAWVAHEVYMLIRAAREAAWEAVPPGQDSSRDEGE